MPIQLIIAAVVAAVAFATGWTANGWRLGQQLADVQATHAQALALAESQARTREQTLVAAKQKAEEAHEANKKQSQRAIAGARTELDRLRDILATRSAPADAAPSAGTDAASCTERELLGEGAGHLADLAAEADRLTATVSGLQGYVRGVCIAPE